MAIVPSIRSFLAASSSLVLTLTIAATGCSSSAGTDVGAGGGTQTSGGGSGKGGSSGSGGSVGSGGAATGGTSANTAQGSGGAGGRGGTSGGGGTLGTGGTRTDPSTGGSSATAGRSGTGGNVPTGGNGGRDGGLIGSGGRSAVDAGTATGGAASGGSTGTGGAAAGGTNGTGGVVNGGTSAAGGTTAGTGGAVTGGAGGGSGPFNPPYILGADISWTLEQESTGAKYQDNGQTKSVERIFADHGFNFIRMRTFVCPNCPGGYDSNLYSGAGPTENWCDTAHTIKWAKRVKACKMGIFLDFHMSDNWASIGHQEVPSAWAGMSPSQMQTAAHDYVKGVLDQMVAAGVKPDIVQIGNETNSSMSGVSMSNWANFSGLMNAGIRAVRETDPKIPVYAQHGRPRPDGGFEAWVDKMLGGNPPIDDDGICGSTYGTTNNGDDWRQEFGYVISKYNKPVMSCEYTNQRRDLINPIMRALPNKMGRGTFLWEPVAYDNPIFDKSGSTYKTNASMAEYDKLAKSYGLPVPSTPAAELDGTTCK